MASPSKQPTADLDLFPRREDQPDLLHARRSIGTHLEAIVLLAGHAYLDDELRGAFILAADTVVAVGRRILPKAELRFTSPATKAKVTIKIPERP